MPPKNPIFTTPSHKATLGEARALVDIAKMLTQHGRSWLRPSAAATQSPVIVIPGFASNDMATWPLRRFLADNGFAAEGWGLGMNVAGENLTGPIDWPVPAGFVDNGELAVPRLIAKVRERVQTRSLALGEKITLIGWSLGGYLAREVAREIPAAVAQVITLAAPVHGGPKYTLAAAIFKRRGVNLDWVELEIAKRDAMPITIPVTAIVSPTDGIVSYAAACDHNSQTKLINVNASHIGMGFRQEIWDLILDILLKQNSTK